MKRLMAIVCAIALVGCSGSRPEEVAPSETTEVASFELDDPPTVMITPTGVIVPVLASVGSTVIVSTPCGRDAELVGGQPLRDIEVVIDPGHGGDELGATSGGITEAAVNLAVAQQTAAALDSRGIRTALTRMSDYRLPVTSRVALIDAFAPQVYVSIHHNSAPVEPSEIPGTEIYPMAGQEESRRLAGLLYGNVVDSLVGFDAVGWISARDAGVIEVLNDDGEDAYGIVRGPTPPGVLAELAYISNPTEAEFIAGAEYQRVVSGAMADAIESYLTQPNARGRGFIEDQRNFEVDSSTGGTEACVDPELS